MNAKRQNTTNPVSVNHTASYYLIDEDTRRQLASVGPRARKIVSDGYLTGTTIPSFKGITVGSMNQEQLREQYITRLKAWPVHSVDEVALKRSRRHIEEDDDGGDTDVDEDVEMEAIVDYTKKTYFRPNGLKSYSSHREDFDDASFLKPPH